MIRLETDTLRLTIDPLNGASIRSFDWKASDDLWVPVFAEVNSADPTANGAACFPMVPFANRARDNLLINGEQTYPLIRNTADKYALHGVGWQRAWSIQSHDAISVRLELEVADGFPFPFNAEMTLVLDGPILNTELSVTNIGASDIPLGLGLHPYVPRLAGTKLTFDAERFWEAADDLLPIKSVPIPSELDFSAPRAMPDRLIDNCFDGWSGDTVIHQPDLGYQLSLHAGPELRHLMLYTPLGAPHFAIEPQSHLSGETR
ncbi:MAG: aldose 1-epimerase, partial [Pseudomonadota bacterium]